MPKVEETVRPANDDPTVRAACEGARVIGGRLVADIRGAFETQLRHNANAVKAYDYFVDKGLSPAQAAGVVGNLMLESGCDPTKPQEDGGKGLGLAQWTKDGPRWAGLETFARSEAKAGATMDFDVQLQFVWHELNTTRSAALAAIRGASTVGQATVVAQDLYENPDPNAAHTAERLGYAKAALAVFGLERAVEALDRADCRWLDRADKALLTRLASSLEGRGDLAALRAAREGLEAANADMQTNRERSPVSDTPASRIIESGRRATLGAAQRVAEAAEAAIRGQTAEAVSRLSHQLQSLDRASPRIDILSRTTREVLSALENERQLHVPGGRDASIATTVGELRSPDVHDRAKLHENEMRKKLDETIAGLKSLLPALNEHRVPELEALKRVSELLASFAEPLVREDDINRIWIEAGGKGEPPRRMP